MRRMLWCGLLVMLACRREVITAVTDTPRVGDNGQTYVPVAEWRTAAPAAVGFDAGRIEQMKRDVTQGRFGSIHGVLVVRYGYLVVEHYNGWARAVPHTMQSVTKSVTSLLLGALRMEHDIALDAPVLGVFARYPAVANVDERKQALTVRHLLTMRTGMDFWEQPYAGSPLDQLNRSSGDWVKLVLDSRMSGDPGARWAYNSGAAIAIGGLIRDFAGENTDAYARRVLFEPLGITGETWYRSPFDGLPHCGGGLALKATDMARLGYLVLREGRWGAQQVVPAEWIRESTQPVSRGSPVFFSTFGAGYGYFWWTFPGARGGTDADVIAASGSGGQWLFVMPGRDLVVAVVASNGNGLDLFYDAILPALGD